MAELLKWNIYEITAKKSSLNGVKLRGRIRKFGLESGINVLVENTEDITNGVRFATLSVEDGERVGKYVKSVIGDAEIKLVNADVVNPVLSKLKVNLKERYAL